MNILHTYMYAHTTHIFINILNATHAHSPTMHTTYRWLVETSVLMVDVYGPLFCLCFYTVFFTANLFLKLLYKHITIIIFKLLYHFISSLSCGSLRILGILLMDHLCTYTVVEL